MNAEDIELFRNVIVFQPKISKKLYNLKCKRILTSFLKKIKKKLIIGIYSNKHLKHNIF